MHLISLPTIRQRPFWIEMKSPSSTGTCTVPYITMLDGKHLCDLSMLLWFGVCGLHYLPCHLLCPEPPPGTTTVHCWYRVHCLVYLMCGSVELFWCVDAIISVSILQ